jgi:CBS domain-containing protein
MWKQRSKRKQKAGCSVIKRHDVMTEQEEAVRGLTARDVMTQDVLSVRADWSKERLTEFLVENSISGAPVISETGKLIGVVSLTDIALQETLPSTDPQSSRPHDYYLHALEHHYAREEISSFSIREEPRITVRSFMTPMVFKVNEDTRVQQVAETMIKKRIHRVFVTREERVVGVVAALDMLKVIRDM